MDKKKKKVKTVKSRTVVSMTVHFDLPEGKTPEWARDFIKKQLKTLSEVIGEVRVPSVDSQVVPK